MVPNRAIPVGVIVAAALGAALWIFWSSSGEAPRSLPEVDRSSARPSVDRDPSRTEDGSESKGSGRESPALTGEARREIPNVPYRSDSDRELLGRAVDLQDRPVPGASVRVWDFPEYGKKRLWEAETDSEGNFRLSPLPSSGSTTFELRHPSFLAVRQTVSFADRKRVDLGILRLEAAGQVSGTVAHADGTGVEGAWIRVAFVDATKKRPLLVPAELTTGKGGAFRISSLPGGEFHLEIHPPAHPALTAGPYAVPPGGELPGLRITVPGDLTLGGLVTELSGAPIARAEVLLESPWAPGIELGEDLREAPLRFFPKAVFSDGEGRFRFDRLPEGTFRVRARAQGFLASTPVEWRSGTADLRISLEPVGEWGGLVLDGSTSEPLGKFDVQVLVGEGNQAAKTAVLYGPASDSSSSLLRMRGSFALAEPPVEPFSILIRAEGYAPLQSGPHAAPLQGSDRPRFLLHRGATVCGAVRDQDSRPVAAAKVTLRGVFGRLGTFVEMRSLLRAFSASSQETETDAEGKYCFSSVVPGEYEVRASKEAGALSEAVRFTLGAGDSDLTVDLRAADPGFLEGAVRDSKGSPASGATVGLVRDGETFATTAAAEDGSYKIARLPAGRFAVFLSEFSSSNFLFSADPATKEIVAWAEVLQGKGARLDLTMPSKGALRGKVFQGGRPLQGAEVLLWPQGVSAAFFGKRTARSGEDGSFDFSGLGAGTYLAVVKPRPASWPLRRTLRIEAGETREESFQAPQGELEGSVLDATSDAPLAGLPVRLFLGEEPFSFDEDPQSLALCLAQTDGQGKFRFQDLPPGTYRVGVRGEGRVVEPPVAVSVPSSGTPKPIVLRPRGAFSLKVVCLDRKSGARVGTFPAELLGPDGARYRGLSDFNGEIKFSDVGEGSYVLRASEPDVSGETAVKVGAASPSTVIWELEVGG